MAARHPAQIAMDGDAALILLLRGHHTALLRVLRVSAPHGRFQRLLLLLLAKVLQHLWCGVTVTPLPPKTLLRRQRRPYVAYRAGYQAGRLLWRLEGLDVPLASDERVLPANIMGDGKQG